MNRLKSLTITCLAVLVTALWGLGPPAAQALVVDPANGFYIPDYFNTPNWANSPPLAKFVDPLPQLGDTGVPIARPDVVTYPGADYYEISLEQYSQLMHSGMGPTTLRGYVQTNNGTDTASCGGAGQPACTAANNTLAPAPIRYLGPVILATKGRPVRVKFTNNLPGGDLFIPVDPTVMGSGVFMIDYDPATKAPIPTVSGMFSQSRATLHLHGGLSPWISDGTTHQWTAPVNEATDYPKGVSVAYVPDMWFDATTGATISSCAGLETCGIAGATNNPGPGKLTFFWTNDQSARFMFYHDHAYGITRLNVYAGEAAGYLINDAALEDRLAGLGVPGTIGTTPATTDLAHLVPLVIQDKTFVDAATIMTTDPTWAWGTNPGKPATTTPVSGDLWWPHVYMPAQNPFNPNLSGINDMGRWHYGPWFFPPTPLCVPGTDAVKPFCIEFGPVPNEYYAPNCDPTVAFCQPPERPGTHNPSWGAEAFLDTMVVNGAAYPTLPVQPTKYRLRILNASHDRFLNLQMYKASPIVSGITVDPGSSGYTSVPAVTITPAVGDVTGHGATATATIDPATGAVIAVTLDTVGSGYTAAPTVTIAPPPPGGVQAIATAAIYTALTEVGMVPAALTAGFPAMWPTDGREGGVPDPATRGPAFIQIGTEGGVLPAPVVLPNQPVQWNMDPTMFNVGNVLQQRDGGGTLLLGPAERADVIVDFTDFAGQTLILYNDAPTAFPALDPHYDYYTGAPDRTDIGGYGPVPPGVGPNVRTVMQIVVGGAGGAATPDHYDPLILTNLRNAFMSTATTQGIFAQTQHPIIVGQSAYGSSGNSAYYTAGSDCDPSAATQTCFPAIAPYWGLSNIFSTELKYDTVLKDQAGVISLQRIGTDPQLNPATPFQMKAIHDEMGATFDDYGRMSAKLGLEVPFVNAAIQNFILQNFVDPLTEIVKPDEVQIWRITHNGVDTHPIHFHLFDVQLLNRVGWDGFIRLPDDNELGWKDTIRIAPLEDTIVALRPVRPQVPFKLPNSVRPLNPTMPLGDTTGFAQIDITDGADLVPPLTNQLINFGHEYTWHCHILSHEENDMMRATSLAVPPEDPSGLTAVPAGSGNNRRVDLGWLDNSRNDTSFTVQRATASTGPWSALATLPSTGTTGPTMGPRSYTDPIGNTNTTYYYRVFASNTVGGPAPYPIVTADSGFSNTATFATVPTPPAAPSNVQASAFRFNNRNDRVTLTWTDNANNETGFRIQRASDQNFTLGVTTSTVGANVTTFTTGNLPRGATFYFRVQAFNAAGTSAYVDAANNPITTP
ncbi:MAG: multicopper oxidase domain-containing protein [Geobacteraceae bacterium]|nr:multicopper oxidase domain-containing protein [Geobacteraceae bacterium]